MRRFLLCRKSALLFRKVFESFTCGSKDSPVIQRLCAERKVKVHARLVPVKAAPFKASVAALYGNSCKFL